jgi:vacuolar-type H+-ATPase subunit E/Vma4
MGHKELIDSLQQEGEDKIRQLWKDAEIEAETVRTETSSKIGLISKEFRNKELIEIQDREQEILSEAASKAGKIKLQAERTLSDRLFLLALSCLHELKNGRYAEAFESIVKEIPHAEWKKVRVHPDDMKIAETYFASSDIIPDDRISGGLEAVSENNKVFINNTFEKRLERAWDDLLPLLISEIYKEGIDSGTPSDS